MYSTFLSKQIINQNSNIVKEIINQNSNKVKDANLFLKRPSNDFLLVSGELAHRYIITVKTNY